MIRPEIKNGKCCFYCKHGSTETDRCGEISQYCDKYNDMVFDTSVCEDFVSEGE